MSADSLPDFMKTWFSIPWHRCYTVNIDDLEVAVARRFDLGRTIQSISATSGRKFGNSSEGALEVVHLNGFLGDSLEDLTFSDSDYGRRQIAPEEWLVRCSTDLVAHPVVFVGTRLREPTLWQYMEFRRSRAKGDREFRPGSYLVTPQLDSARRVVLEDLNVDWIQMDASEFATEVLAPMADAVQAGKATLRDRLSIEIRSRYPSLISELISTERASGSEYLMGQEPTWRDLQAGTAIQRTSDATVYDVARSILAGDQPKPLVISGTAGSGKSTSLMRLGMRLSAEGVPVYWIDERSNIEPYRLRELVARDSEPIAILVDDADVWGRFASGWARELPQMRRAVLFAVAVRSTRVEALFDTAALGGDAAIEVSMPPLEDPDIKELIAVLDRNNRLGVLKGKSDHERFAAFRDQAGRQLLVAMIQATLGQPFRDKILEELTELPNLQKQIYASVCIVTAQRTTLDRDEVVLAIGGGNEVLAELEKLIGRHLIVRDPRSGSLTARHRLVAEEAVNGLRTYMGQVLEGICFAFATKIDTATPRHSRQWRRMARFINHEFLLSFCAKYCNSAQHICAVRGHLELGMALLAPPRCTRGRGG